MSKPRETAEKKKGRSKLGVNSRWHGPGRVNKQGNGLVTGPTCAKEGRSKAWGHVARQQKKNSRLAPGTNPGRREKKRATSGRTMRQGRPVGQPNQQATRAGGKREWPVGLGPALRLGCWSLVAGPVVWAPSCTNLGPNLGPKKMGLVPKKKVIKNTIKNK